MLESWNRKLTLLFQLIVSSVHVYIYHGDEEMVLVKEFKVVDLVGEIGRCVDLKQTMTS